MDKPKNNLISIHFFPIQLKGAVVVSLPRPTFEDLKRAAGERLKLQSSSLGIFGIFLGSLASPKNLCIETDVVPKNISKVCLRRLSFNKDEERRVVDKDDAAMTLIFWEVKQEYDQRRIQPGLNRFETKVLEKELRKGWCVPVFGSMIWPSVDSMKEFLRCIRTKRSSYYWSYYYKAELCSVNYSEPIFAGVLPGIGDGDGLMLHLAMDKTGLIFLDTTGKELCCVPWCTVHRVKKDTGAKLFTFDIQAKDEYGIIHSVNVPVQTDHIDYLYSMALHILTIQDNVLAWLNSMKPRTLTTEEYKLLDSIRPKKVKFDQFMSWVLPIQFQSFLQLHTREAKYRWVKYEYQLPPQQLQAKGGLPTKKALGKCNKKMSSLKDLLSSPEMPCSLRLVTSSLVSNLQVPFQWNFAIAYLTYLNSLNLLLKEYSTLKDSTILVDSTVLATPSKLRSCRSAPCELYTTSSQGLSETPTQMNSSKSAIDWLEVPSSKEPSLVPSSSPPEVHEHTNKNFCEEIILFQLDFAKALKLLEDKAKLESSVTGEGATEVEQQSVVVEHTTCTREKDCTGGTVEGKDTAVEAHEDGKAESQEGIVESSEETSTINVKHLPFAHRVITVRAFGNKSFEVPLQGDHCTVGQFKQYVGCHYLNLKKPSCNIFGIFLRPLGSPGAYFSDCVIFPANVSYVCLQRVSFDVQEEHTVIKSDLAAVDLLYCEAKYMFKQGMILPKPTEEDEMRLKQLIQSKSKTTFVKKMSGMHVGTRRFPELSHLAEYWWMYYHRAEFCALQDCIPVHGQLLVIGTVLHIALSKDLLTVLDMDDIVRACWSLDCVQCVLMQNTETNNFIVFEILQGKREGEECNNLLRYLVLETHHNEYLFSLAEHIFRLRETRSTQLREAVGLSVTQESKVINDNFYTTAYKLEDDDPVFRAINRTASGPLEEGDETSENCKRSELQRIYQTMAKAIVKTNACKITNISLI